MITITGDVLSRTRRMILRELDGEDVEQERVTYILASAEDSSLLYRVVDYDVKSGDIYEKGKNTIPVEVFLYCDSKKGIGCEYRVAHPSFEEESF